MLLFTYILYIIDLYQYCSLSASIRESVPNTTAEQQLPVSPSAPSHFQNPPLAKKQRQRKRAAPVEDVEKLLISSIQYLQDDKARDEEAAFADSVAARLRCLMPQQKAIAYIEIDKLLLRVQCPNDPYFNPPSAPFPYQHAFNFLSHHPPHSSSSVVLEPISSIQEVNYD